MQNEKQQTENLSIKIYVDSLFKDRFDLRKKGAEFDRLIKKWYFMFNLKYYLEHYDIRNQIMITYYIIYVEINYKD
jgi:hypothetical protein